MINPQFQLPIHHELVVDLFAGGGGASTGIELAIGRAVDVAVNHDPEAVSVHPALHPRAEQRRAAHLQAAQQHRKLGQRRPHAARRMPPGGVRW